jgi:hypothetical protein
LEDPSCFPERKQKKRSECWVRRAFPPPPHDESCGREKKGERPLPQHSYPMQSRDWCWLVWVSKKNFFQRWQVSTSLLPVTKKEREEDEEVRMSLKGVFFFDFPNKRFMGVTSRSLPPQQLQILWTLFS